MLDLITYALLKSQINEAATGIQGAEVKGGELVFTLSDGSVVSAGKLWDNESSPITNVSFEGSLLIVEHLDGKKETLDLPTNGVKNVELQDTNLVFTFSDNTQLIAPIAGKQITAAEIKYNHLIFTFSDSSTLDAGELLIPALSIDDTKTSKETTYSSKFINELLSYDLVVGGGAESNDSFLFSDLVSGGGADAPDQDILIDAGDRAW